MYEAPRFDGRGITGDVVPANIPELPLRPRVRQAAADAGDLARGQRRTHVADALESLKALESSLAYRKSCREGVCGSDAMNIDGKNGLACLANLNVLPQTTVLKPLPGLPVVRDSFVDMTGFSKQYHSVRPNLVNATRPPERERLRSPLERSALDGSM